MQDYTTLTELALMLLAIGAVGGLISGMLGIGGGMVFVPALYYTFTHMGSTPEKAMHVAIATSLGLVMFTGATSAYWHHKKGSVDFKILKSWGPFVVTGVAVGTYFASSMDGGFLKKFFAAAALVMAVYMARSKEKEKPDDEPLAAASHGTIPRKNHGKKALLYAVCVVIGAIAAMIGIGGAMMTIPAMTYTGTPMRKAVGTGGAIGTAIAIPGVIGYILSGWAYRAELPPYSLGYINLLALVMIVPLSFMLSPVGVHISHSMPRTTLRRLFAVLLFVVSIRMFTAA